MTSSIHDALVADLVSHGFHTKRFRAEAIKYCIALEPPERSVALEPAVDVDSEECDEEESVEDFWQHQVFGRFRGVPDAWVIQRYEYQRDDGATEVRHALIAVEVEVHRPMTNAQVWKYADLWEALDYWWSSETPVNLRVIVVDRNGFVREVLLPHAAVLQVCASAWYGDDDYEKLAKAPTNFVPGRYWETIGRFARDGLGLVPCDEDEIESEGVKYQFSWERCVNVVREMHGQPPVYHFLECDCGLCESTPENVA